MSEVTWNFELGEQAECDNCGEKWHAYLLQPIRDFAQRVEPGSICPAGECPKCFALCYLIPDEAKFGVLPERRRETRPYATGS